MPEKSLSRSFNYLCPMVTYTRQDTPLKIHGTSSMVKQEKRNDSLLQTLIEPITFIRGSISEVQYFFFFYKNIRNQQNRFYYWITECIGLHFSKKRYSQDWIHDSYDRTTLVTQRSIERISVSIWRRWVSSGKRNLKTSLISLLICEREDALSDGHRQTGQGSSWSYPAETMAIQRKPSAVNPCHG